MTPSPTPDPSLLADLFERSPAMLAYANVEGRVMFVNPAWSACLGDGAAPVAGQPLLELVHADDREAAAAAWAAVVGGAQAVAGGEHRFADAGGAWLPLRWQGVLAGDGAHVHVVASGAGAEHAAADAALRELEAFTECVSHDLRAPVRAIDGFAQILLAGHAEHLPEDTRRFLGLVRDSATELAGQLDDLVALARISRAPLRVTDADPAAVARAVAADLAARHPGRDVVWEIDAMPACRADPELLRRLYEALLDNALKFSDERTPAHVAAAWDDEAAAYVVRDDGAGFDDALAAKAFGIFQRLHPRERYPGSGVGLAVASRIVARHGGRIWARSRPGEGATIWFTMRVEGLEPPRPKATRT